MGDVFAGLNSLSFEAGLTEDEKELLYLRARTAGLQYCGSAHAVFLCELVHTLRGMISRRTAKSPAGNDDLCVGILGMGRMGKKLLLFLLAKSGIRPSYIKVSTRRPESAEELIHTEVECFFDNRRLASWADILFLCCLPSHLPKVCADLHSNLSKSCLVYSFTSAVPCSRLSQLLGHDFILKPQYDLVVCDTMDVWLSCSPLSDPLLIELSCPLSMSGGITLSPKWVCGLLYILLNICTAAGLGSSDALSLINSLLKKCPHTAELNVQSFISEANAPCLPKEECFPWISLTNVQTKDTPLLAVLSSSNSIQPCISAAYKSLMKTAANTDTL
ncbi:NADP-dependent oxidoreductase domain-containing protein 1 [Antennarius striatus]|uniref:NADP-dependent oxidoreductase domain-containing protein 1 n=1 Tax=Antennarius striatus TaxID=241820 RepID=UPI0035AF8F67